MPNEISLSPDVKINYKLACWQQSALRGCESQVQIVWVPKDGNERPYIEGHFAGSKAECEQFRQTHSLIPKGTMRVKQGLSGVNRQETIHTQNQSQNIELAWTLKESLGNAVLEGNITELPDVSVVAKMLYTLVYSLHTSYTHLMNNL